MANVSFFLKPYKESPHLNGHDISGQGKRLLPLGRRSYKLKE
jgi:hypothetical protein